MKLVEKTIWSLAAIQLLFGAICAYMVAAIDDNVWNGVRLDDLMGTALAVGGVTCFIAFLLSFMMADLD